MPKKYRHDLPQGAVSSGNGLTKEHLPQASGSEEGRGLLSVEMPFWRAFWANLFWTNVLNIALTKATADDAAKYTAGAERATGIRHVSIGWAHKAEAGPVVSLEAGESAMVERTTRDANAWALAEAVRKALRNELMQSSEIDQTTYLDEFESDRLRRSMWDLAMDWR